MSDAAHDRQANNTVDGIIQESLTKLVIRYELSERRREERKKETMDNFKSEQERTEKREHVNGFEAMVQIDLLTEILKELKETNALMKLTNITTTQKDNY